MTVSYDAKLYTQGHDTVHDIIVVLLERLDRLLPAHTSLRHDELDVLAFQTSLIDLLTVIFLLFGGLLVFDSLALVARAAVLGLGLGSGLSGELLGGGSLGLGVEIFDFGFAENAIRDVSVLQSLWLFACNTHIQVLLFGLL